MGPDLTQRCVSDCNCMPLDHSIGLRWIVQYTLPIGARYTAMHSLSSLLLVLLRLRFSYFWLNFATYRHFCGHYR